jgi:hypothetical protein
MPSPLPAPSPSSPTRLQDRWIIWAVILLLTFFAAVALYAWLDRIRWTPTQRSQTTPAPAASIATGMAVGTTGCARTTPHAMRPEFDRGISLVIQRLSEGPGANWQKMAKYLGGIRHCVNVQYAASAEAMAGAEGQFRFSPTSSPDNLIILVHPSYQSKSDLYTAALLSHEMSHAASFAHGTMLVRSKTTEGCYEEEAQAFLAEGMFSTALNAGEQAQIIQESFVAHQSGSVNEALAMIHKRNQIMARPEADYLDKIRGWVRAHPGYQQQCRR